MPPPYAPPISMNTEPSVICRVCQQLIYIRGREHQRVVKCGNCQEATVSSINVFSQVCNKTDFFKGNNKRCSLVKTFQLSVLSVSQTKNVGVQMKICTEV